VNEDVLSEKGQQCVVMTRGDVSAIASFRKLSNQILS
jgi:hypothetical protein